jgi:uroporphyrinogen-III synthase
MSGAHVSPYLAVWTVISLRPVPQQASMRRAIAARGAHALALPALRLGPMADATAARRALRAALSCPRVLFTSPAAVSHAAALAPLTCGARQRMFAVGRGTARALARHGVVATHPAEHAMRSEGLLALPDFAPGSFTREHAAVGLVTAPGGRGLLAHALRARGAQLHVAEVYRRLPPRFDRRHRDALLASSAPRALLLTSGEALDNVLAGLPPEALVPLRDSLVVASSARLAQQARDSGFARTLEAGAPTAQALLDALEAHARGTAPG